MKKQLLALCLSFLLMGIQLPIFVLGVLFDKSGTWLLACSLVYLLFTCAHYFNVFLNTYKEK